MTSIPQIPVSTFLMFQSVFLALFGIMCTIIGFVFKAYFKKMDINMQGITTDARIHNKEAVENRFAVQKDKLDKVTFRDQVLVCSKLHLRLETKMNDLSIELPKMESRILKEIRNGNKQK